MEAPKELTLEEVNAAITPLERKYDWGVEDLGEGKFELFVTDGAYEGREEVTTLDGIEDVVRKAHEEVDSHDYPIIG